MHVCLSKQPRKLSIGKPRIFLFGAVRMASLQPNHVESLVGHFRAAVLEASLPLSGVSMLEAIMAINGRPSLPPGRLFCPRFSLLSF